MWPQRVEAAIRRSVDHVAIHARPEFASRVILNGLEMPSQPTVRLILPPGDDPSGVLHGNLLSDALDDAFGFRLFGYGLPVQYGLSVLKAQSQLLGRFTIAVVGAQTLSDDALDALFSLAPSRAKVVAAFENYEMPELSTSLTLLRESDLALTVEECVEIGRGVMEATDIARLCKNSNGAYLEFLTQLNRSTSLPPVQLVSRPSDVPASAAGHIVSLFVRQGRWVEALEIAFEHDVDQGSELFRQSARIVLDQGLSDRLWKVVSQVPADVFEADDELMYLYFVAATAANQHRLLARRVRSYLESHEAPDLRARWSVALPSARSAEECERAYSQLKNSNTLRALAFIRTMQNRVADAVPLLREALELAQTAEDERAICAVALDTSHALVFSGKYTAAKTWARWGLERHSQLSVGDELLRINLVAQVAYLDLLTDEPDAAEELLNTIVLPDSLIGAPMMEAVISTQGDLALFRGDLDAAIERYKRFYRHLPIASVGFAALDLARAHVRSGDVDAAEAVVDEADELTGGEASESPNRVALMIARGHTFLGRRNTEAAIEHYQLSVPSGRTNVTPYLAAQALIGLALAWTTNGEPSKARSVLEKHRECWQELGVSGWHLLAVDVDQALELRASLRGESSSTHVQLLGRRKLMTAGDSGQLSLRIAEVTTLLALTDNGYRAEELLLEIYGDEGKMGSLKALLSRMRSVVPLLSRPYRLDPSVTCDIVHLEELLRVGHLREALELYKGPLLPESEAPGVRRARERIDEAIRQAVLHAGEADLALRLARKFPDDLELWEKARELTPKDDPAYPLIRARIHRIRGEWGL